MLVSQETNQRDSQVKIKRLVYPVGPLSTNCPPLHQSCPSHPLISPPQLGHARCFSHTSHQLSNATVPLLSDTDLGQGWHSRAWRKAGGPGRIYADTGQIHPKGSAKTIIFPSSHAVKETGEKFYIFSVISLKSKHVRDYLIPTGPLFERFNNIVT